MVDAAKVRLAKKLHCDKTLSIDELRYAEHLQVDILSLCSTLAVGDKSVSNTQSYFGTLFRASETHTYFEIRA